MKLSVGNQNKKASMMFLSIEATNKDVQLKTQMFLSLADDESKGRKKVWQEFGIFGDQRAELTIMRGNFPENCFVYINQGQASVVKRGEKAIYLPIYMPADIADPSINFDTYVCKENEVTIYCPVYNKSTGIYGGLTKKLCKISYQSINVSIKHGSFIGMCHHISFSAVRFEATFFLFFYALP